MSKPVKEMISREYVSRFADVQDATLIDIRGIDAQDTTRIRSGLREKRIQVTVVRNSLARKVFEGTGLEPLRDLLHGPIAVACGGESVIEVARELVNLVKEFPELELKGAVLDGELFEGSEGVVRLSTFPTKDEAIAQVVTLVLSPGRNLSAQIQGPGARVAGLIGAIRERLENGEAIQRVE